LNVVDSFLPPLAITQDSWKLWHFGNPAAVIFQLDFNGYGHTSSPGFAPRNLEFRVSRSQPP
jgi:hypothetical protein